MTNLPERADGKARNTGAPDEGRSRRRDRRPARSGAASVEPVKGMTPMGMGLGIAGVLITVLGLWLVSRGDITAAPLLLVLAYLVLFPLALTR